MPSFRETLDLVLHADASGAISELQKFSSETEKQVKNSQSSLQRLSSGGLKLGAGGMAVGGFLTQMASGDIEAANQLKAAIGQVGGSYDELEPKISAAAQSQVKFGHTDEEVSGALTTLTLAYGDANKALDQMQLVADLAARKHISLGDAANLVAKAHGGAGRIFKEFGIQVDTNTANTGRYDQALAELSHKLQGQASASADTFGGKLKAIGAEAENVVSEIGQKFGPAILGVSTGLTAVSGVTQAYTSIVGKMRAAHLANAEAADVDAAASSSLGSKLGKAGIAAGAALAVGALYELGQSLNKVTLDQKDFQRLSDQSWDQQTRAVVAMVQEYKGPFAGAIDDIITHYRNLGPTGVEELKRIRDALAAAGQDTSKFDAAIAGATQQEANMADATDNSTKALEDQKQALKDARKAVKDLDDAYRSIIDSTLDSFDASLKLSDAQIATRKSIDDLNKAQASGAATADELSSKQNDVFEAILAEAQANEANAEAQKKANGETLSARDAQSAVIEELLKVADTLDPNSELRKRIGDYIAQLQNNIPEKVNTSISVDATDALKELAKVQAALDLIKQGLGDSSVVGPGFNVTPPGYEPRYGTTPPPGTGSSGGNFRQSSAVTPQNVFHITTPDPVESAYAVARHQQAQQFLGVR